ncbi:hypothetical protein KVR01_004273 [Diaporthe batatas]|uniref:uncharacterized protein n=1 Tax=Diaporthe batatas TaxID=748121 RepID=UPI001D04D385|nr:uncharacterized protein KVR01_004273 [Diaporthe batatas]KAG8165721.1 hypothetical protein KVR01_004273 [Diaporthe batatas]
MAASRKRVYKQIAVFLPLERSDADPLQRVKADAQVPAREKALDGGFLYVKEISLGAKNKFRADTGERIPLMGSVFIVQSVATGELFLNKILERPIDDNTNLALPPLELRCSTYTRRIDDPSVDLPPNAIPGPNGIVRKGVLPDVPYFNKLRFWQQLTHLRDPHPVRVYSMYFELVAEQLFLAIVAMKFGRYTYHDGSVFRTKQIPNWTRVYHRDLHPNNVFINYIPKGAGRVPKVGIVNNAFPEIVVGDLGNSGVEGDDPAILPQAIYQPLDENQGDDGGNLYDWEDIYSTGEMLRKMSMTHSATGRPNDLDMRPDNLLVDDVNQEPTAPPYSDDLINMLQLFEWDNMGNTTVRDIGDDDAVNAAFPSPDMVKNTLLPQAQGKVRGYKDPAGKPAGYFDTIDVSWTRPEDPMPFSYIMRYATDAGDMVDGQPPPDDGGSSSSGGSSGSGSGDGHDDGDSPMPDSPPASGAGHDGSQGQSDDGSQQQPGSQASSGTGSSGSSSRASPPPAPQLPADQVAMQSLRTMHKWNTAKPRYELRNLEFGTPTILPLKGPP